MCPRARKGVHMIEDLFPESMPESGKPPPRPRWVSTQVDPKYSMPLITVELIPSWSAKDAWVIGWCVMVDKVSADEWMPGTKTRDGWPWYRPDDQPSGLAFGTAAGVAARAAKIVLAQILTYTADPETLAAGRDVSDAMELRARRWLLGEEL